MFNKFKEQPFKGYQPLAQTCSCHRLQQVFRDRLGDRFKGRLTVANVTNRSQHQGFGLEKGVEADFDGDVLALLGLAEKLTALPHRPVLRMVKAALEILGIIRVIMLRCLAGSIQARLRFRQFPFGLSIGQGEASGQSPLDQVGDGGFTKGVFNQGHRLVELGM